MCQLCVALAEASEGMRAQTLKTSQLQTELGTVKGELGAARARLEACAAEKQMLEARLTEAMQDLQEVRKQLTEKGWEAAEAAALAGREMAKQRSESDDKCRLLEKEQAALRDKLHDTQSQLTQVESQKQVLELQKDHQLAELEARKAQELAAQAERLKDLELRAAQAAQAAQRLESDSADGGHSSSDQVQTQLTQIKEQFHEVIVGLKALQTDVRENKEASTAAEHGFQQSRNEVEATALACSALKQQLAAVSDLAKQRVEADAARRAEKFESSVRTADGKVLEATFVPYSADASLEQGRAGDSRQACQLQTELGTVKGELGAARARLEACAAEKQMLEARLTEAMQDLEEVRKQLTEKGWEAAEAAALAGREMAKQRSESDDKCRLLEKEQAALRDKLHDTQSQLTQVESQKQVLELQKDHQLAELEARKAQELAAQAERQELQVEVGRLVAELAKASQYSQRTPEPARFHGVQPAEDEKQKMPGASLDDAKDRPITFSSKVSSDVLKPSWSGVWIAKSGRRTSASHVAKSPGFKKLCVQLV